MDDWTHWLSGGSPNSLIPQLKAMFPSHSAAHIVLKPENTGEKGYINRSLTVPGHELEFVDELYRWDEEGQGFSTTRLGSSQDIPTEKQSKQKQCKYPHSHNVILV